MDENEKKILESLRNFDVTKLFFNNTYVDLDYSNLYPSFINRVDQNGRYSIYFPNQNAFCSAHKNMLKYYGENDHFENNKLRKMIINPIILKSELTEIINLINQQLKSLNINLSDDNNDSESGNNNINEPSLSSDKKINKFNLNDNGQVFDLTGYFTFQLLEGYLNDCLFLISRKLIENDSLNFTEKELLSLIIDIIIYCADVVEKNLKLYKNAYYNRKLLIISQIHAILASFDSLISNLIPFYQNLSNTYVDLNKKLNEVSNLVYQIVLSSKESNSIPLQSLIIFINLITLQLTKGKIEKVNREEIYTILKEHMKNLDKNELIFFKSDSSVKEICNELINNLFNYNMDSYMNEIYFSYLFSCLKCDNLEKKMNALNEINDLIKNELIKKKQINSIFKEFIDKNNILEMFLDDNTHEEIVKRAGDLFKYLAKFNCLNDEIIEKLIEKQKKNNLILDILMQIISELPKEKKEALFNRLTQGIKLDDNTSDNIEYISKLTISCLSSKRKSSIIDLFGKEDPNKIMEIEPDKNYYGLSMIFDYILYNFDAKKCSKENVIIEKAINNFKKIIIDIEETNQFSIEDIHFFLDKLVENIKSNDKHNNIIQSIKLIKNLLNIVEENFDESQEAILKILNQKYDIITLLINDLIRYLNISEDIFFDQEIYEGIYPHSVNIEQRLDLIFYFLKRNFDFMFQGKKHLEKLYKILKPDKCREERRKFFKIMSKCIDRINKDLLNEFYTDILQNKDECDLTKINDYESIHLVIKIFKQINFNKSSILYDGRKIRIAENAEIEGVDMLFNILTKNPNDSIQEQVSELLCQICLFHKNYSNELISQYWVEYFNRINVYLDEIIKTNDKIAFNGIIKLIDKIYKECGNMQGEIRTKSDYISPRKNYKEYNFISMKNPKIHYKLKAGRNDNFIVLRYKISYFFDIPENNVCLVDINDKEYNLNNDFEKFISIFTDEEYFYKKGFEYIKVKIVPFEIEKIKLNPKMLIETNDKIYNILINNLSLNSSEKNTEFQEKEKIWNIILRLPKHIYFEKYLKKYGDEEKIEEEELSRIFNINNIFIFSYYLKCILGFLQRKNIDYKIKEEYLGNLIDVHHLDKLLFNNLLIMPVDSNNLNKITIDCIDCMIDLIYRIEQHKKCRVESANEKNKDNNITILQRLTDIISNLININNSTSNISFSREEYFDDTEEIISELGKNIFIFIKEITNEENTYINFIFKDPEKFINIFVKDFIKCQNEDLKSNINNYLSDNFQKNSDIFLKYLNIVLTKELFYYLVQNDKTGNYFNVISSIITKYFQNKENKEFDPEVYPELFENLKQLINLILNHISQEIEKLETKFAKESKDDENTDLDEYQQMRLFRNKEYFKENLFTLLSNIIKLQPKALVSYITNKVDICDFFLNKCNLRRCTEKPLETPDSYCLNNQSKASVHKLILNIIRNSENENQVILYKKVIAILDNYNKTGFWKTYNVSNWEIEHREMQKSKYIGLKNMNSTCYLNSIIQQLYMIPTFRETIIQIENPLTTNVLYELQLLFSALNIYQNSYYDPKSFVIANNLNFSEQMDADEFYGTIIDKIEKDIRDIYSHEDIDKNKENKTSTYKYKDIFNFFFGIKVLDELHFVDCGHKRYNEFCYYNIQVEIKNCNNLYESLNNYFKAEVMDGNNKINCEECNTKRICHKHLLLKSLPHTLVICLKRFEFDYETMLKFKLNKYFEFPFQLNMKDYMIENHKEKCTEFDLTGIVVHNGVSDFGHYYDLIKTPDNKWYKFNDEYVREFKEEDIPNEAFGNKDLEDDEDDAFSDKEKGLGRRNAYILFYTKRTDYSNEELEKYYLALPPYNKDKNIKKEIREKINFKLYKSWLIQNIFSPWYQNFVLGLCKTNEDKKTKLRFRTEHAILKEEEEKKEDNKSDMIIKDSYDINEMDSIIFQFFLRYYFNVVSRIIKRTPDKSVNDLREKFRKFISNYIENDINKSKYLLEEFSNKEAIDEYLTFCYSKYDINFLLELINKSFINLYQRTDLSNENSFIFSFLNSWLMYIGNNILSINLENVNSMIYKIINLNTELFLSYMKDKNIDGWINSLIRKYKMNEISNSVFNEENLPMVHSNHSILIEKTMKTEDNYDNLMEKNRSDEKDALDIQFLNNLSDMESNNHLLEQLKKNL